jgi:hypothetical protein
MDNRFGRIEFAIGCDVTNSFKQAVDQVSETDWHPVYKEVGGRKIDTGIQWAEVCFVSNKVALSKKGSYRYIAKRQVLAEQPLPGMEESQMSLPFPVMEMGSTRYKIFGMVVDHDTRVESEFDDEKAGTGTIHGPKKDKSHSVFHHQSAGPGDQTVPSAHIEDL